MGDLSPLSNGPNNNNLDALKVLEERRSNTGDEIDIKTLRLVDSKDRAQIVSIVSLSVVQVVLLKTVLDAGPQGHLYYTPSLVLISVALTFQILAGILSVVIANAKNIHGSSRRTVCGEFLDNVCCCRFKTQRKKTKVYKDGFELFDVTGSPPVSPAPGDSGRGDGKEKGGGGCCGCEWKGGGYDEHEYKTMDRFERWQAAMLDVEMKAATTDQELHFLGDIVIEAKRKLNELEVDMHRQDMDDNHSEGGASYSIHENSFDDHVTEIKQRLDMAEKKKQEFEDRKRKLKLMRIQGQILQENVNTIVRNRVLKTSTFWQNFLNYLLYAILLLNTFITALGLATPQTGNNSDN